MRIVYFVTLWYQLFPYCSPLTCELDVKKAKSLFEIRGWNHFLKTCDNNPVTLQCGARALSGSGFWSSWTLLLSTPLIVPRRLLEWENATLVWPLETPAKPWSGDCFGEKCLELRYDILWNQCLGRRCAKIMLGSFGNPHHNNGGTVWHWEFPMIKSRVKTLMGAWIIPNHKPRNIAATFCGDLPGDWNLGNWGRFHRHPSTLKLMMGHWITVFFWDFFFGWKNTQCVKQMNIEPGLVFVNLDARSPCPRATSGSSKQIVCPCSSAIVATARSWQCQHSHLQLPGPAWRTHRWTALLKMDQNGWI